MQAKRFVVVFGLILGLGFAGISVAGVNDHLVEPWTGLLAVASGEVLGLIGEEVSVIGPVVRGRFAVAIENGCNGIEAMLIYLAAVLAYPATWRWRGIGLLFGMLVLQAVNLVRVVALYLTGIYFPTWFDASHTAVWQSILVLVSALLWMLWAKRGQNRTVSA